MELATIDFHGDTLFAFEREGEPFVAMRPIVEALGLDWSAQYRRIDRDPILKEAVAMMATPSSGGVQETICLPLHLLNGWLFGVDAARVRPEIRDKITLYRRECFQVLADHFGPSGQEVALPHVPQLHDGLTLQERRQMVNEARVTFCRQSARELWEVLGLPMTPSMRSLTTSRSASQDDLKGRILQQVHASPGATQRDIIKRFQRHGYSRVKALLAEMERDGMILQDAQRPVSGGHPVILVRPTTH
ncbi:phage antirepressor N-terminal domain-containing protein [Brevundimonas sp.]|uniref:phage antirepressor N-terminal domain-containing protein n=1 Tax=Brevundimonas sp. TaxID=1871086 RepID=UPI0025BDC920|nr:phage antirepressor N-terminal domain-containing protein [Brevundimonas sp.]